jgi:translation initiation factor 2B subunit (eIF-2B alpha/beta/delta family)
MELKMKVRKILEDRVSGSTKITEETCELIKESISSGIDGDDLKAVLNKILEAHRPMAMLHNCIRYSMESGDPEKFMENMRNNILKASELAFEYMKNKSIKNILTLSSSSAVEGALSLFDGAIYVMESRPMLEGIKMAERLSEKGRDVIVVTDAYGISMVARGEVDVVAIGADGIYKNMIINKVGSYALSVASRHSGTEFIAIATSDKIFPEDVELSEGDIMQFHDPGEITGVVRAINPYFEAFEIDKMMKVFTEKGALKSSFEDPL